MRGKRHPGQRLPPPAIVAIIREHGGIRHVHTEPHQDQDGVRGWRNRLVLASGLSRSLTPREEGAMERYAMPQAPAPMLRTVRCPNASCAWWGTAEERQVGQPCPGCRTHLVPYT